MRDERLNQMKTLRNTRMERKKPQWRLFVSKSRKNHKYEQQEDWLEWGKATRRTRNHANHAIFTFLRFLPLRRRRMFTSRRRIRVKILVALKTKASENLSRWNSRNFHSSIIGTYHCFGSITFTYFARQLPYKQSYYVLNTSCATD